MSFRKLLVPTDFSEHSAAALDMACQLAKLGAHITLLHVCHIPVYALPEGAVIAGAAVVGDIVAEASESLERERAHAQTRTGLAIDTLAPFGNPATEIVRIARDGGYDLVIMGKHGRTGLRRALLGSVAEQVVRHAPCPVLTVPLSRGSTVVKAAC
jgi:nucleotide-binding universal stress UspA family protein